MSEPQQLDLALLRGRPLPRFDRATDKDSRGRVFMVAGSELSPGAARLAGEAALRGGAGKVLVATHAAIAIHLGLLAPEFGIVALPPQGGDPVITDEILIHQLEKCDACVLGPGMFNVDIVRPMVLAALKGSTKPLLLDALAVVALQGHWEAVRGCRAPTVLTPHCGEMAALMGASREEIESKPLEFARRGAAELKCTMVLKGATTYIVDPKGETWEHEGGVIGLATAGSGDTLAGLIASFLARGADPATAALWGVAVHAKAGSILSERYGETGLLARELAAEFPLILTKCH